MTTTAKKIHLQYYAILREQRGLDQEQIMTDALTPLALYKNLRAQHRFSLPDNKISVAVNQQFCALDYDLCDGDSVVFIPPVAGG